jgi:hypothetical protein
MTLSEIADTVGGFVHDAEPDTVVAGPARHGSRLLEPDAGRIVSAAVARGGKDGYMPDASAALELVRRRWAAGDAVPVGGANARRLQSPARQRAVDGATPDHATAERNGK